MVGDSVRPATYLDHHMRTLRVLIFVISWKITIVSSKEYNYIQGVRMHAAHSTEPYVLKTPLRTSSKKEEGGMSLHFYEVLGSMI